MDSGWLRWIAVLLLIGVFFLPYERIFPRNGRYGWISLLLDFLSMG